MKDGALPAHSPPTSVSIGVQVHAYSLGLVAPRMLVRVEVGVQ